jgi:hypothetical protein
MAVDVEVNITPTFKEKLPDETFTAKQLGVWEMVRLVSRKPDLKRQEVAPIGSCYFVKDLFVSIDFDLEYFIASDFNTNIINATNASNKQVANFWRGLLLKIKSHAKEHYDQFESVIAGWKADIKSDLVKTLPTDKKPTSAAEAKIKEGIGILVSDWLDELQFRLRQRAFKWEEDDYPKIEKQMKDGGVFLPDGLPRPPKPGKPPKRQTVTFPPFPGAEARRVKP